MKIAIACPDFENLSGGPMFVYDLSRELVAKGHEVLVMAHAVGGEITKRAEGLGVVVRSMDAKLRQTSAFTPDVLHVHGVGPGHRAVATFEAPAVATVHSSLVYETPLVHERVRHYACVRPQIQDLVVERYGIDRTKTSVVFNGVDMQRFCPSEEKFDVPTILFAGTVDYLRAQATHKTWEIAEELGWEVLFIGRKMSGQLDGMPSFVKYMEGDLWDIEEITRKCSATSGILLGRTLLEGWACGLPGYVFEINTEGEVQSWGRFEPPPPQLMAIFDSRYMAECYERLYERVQ